MFEHIKTKPLCMANTTSKVTRQRRPDGDPRLLPRGEPGSPLVQWAAGLTF